MKILLLVSVSDQWRTVWLLWQDTQETADVFRRLGWNTDEGCCPQCDGTSILCPAAWGFCLLPTNMSLISGSLCFHPILGKLFTHGPMSTVCIIRYCTGDGSWESVPWLDIAHWINIILCWRGAFFCVSHLITDHIMYLSGNLPLWWVMIAYDVLPVDWTIDWSLNLLIDNDDYCYY